MVIDTAIKHLMYDNAWRVPVPLITRENKEVDTSGYVWDLPIPARKNARINFNKIQSPDLRLALMYYVAERIRHVSTTSGYTAYWEVWRTILANYNDPSIQHEKTLTKRLIFLFEKSISAKKNEHKLHQMYVPIQWYIYCAESYPELGFCQHYAFELDCMIIPAGPRGEAVRQPGSETGPLDHSLELPLVINALKNDFSNDFEHVRQRAALALSLAYGRNPANLTFLREEDFFDLTQDTQECTYVLRIPRIKKGLLNPRDDFLEEYVEPFYAQFIIDLIEKNSTIETSIIHRGMQIPNPRPLFTNRKGNVTALMTNDLENAYNCASADITHLIQAFVQRHKIISPKTGDPLYINSRRLRYTLATGLAAEGISKWELARILDHTDTQHVNVYFELRGRIVDHLDKAAAKKLSDYYSYFSGSLIASDREAVNGDRDNKHMFYIDDENPHVVEDIGVCGKSGLCHLDPPFSCYLCPKFQAYDFANHEYVLDRLLESREKKIKKYEDARLGVQIDDVIAAVAQVCRTCERISVSA